MPDNVPDVNALIMRAYSLIQQTSGMVFVGIYSMETHEPLALADRDKVCVNITEATEEDPASNFVVRLHEKELKAISNHIQTRDNVLSRIDIIGLHFVCLRAETNCMTGMSNFNTDITVTDANRILQKIANKRYSAVEIAEGFHALQISAVIKDDKLIVGISNCESESSLKVLKQMFQTNDFHLRQSTKADKERRRDVMKRQTSFCEDWRKATVRSIETLKRIGPYHDDDISDDDDSPLMTNIQQTATSPLPAVSHEWPVSFEMDDEEMSKTKGFVRRPSRATMV